MLPVSPLTSSPSRPQGATFALQSGVCGDHHVNSSTTVRPTNGNTVPLCATVARLAARAILQKSVPDAGVEEFSGAALAPRLNNTFDEFASLVQADYGGWTTAATVKMRSTASWTEGLPQHPGACLEVTRGRDHGPATVRPFAKRGQPAAMSPGRGRRDPGRWAKGVAGPPSAFRATRDRCGDACCGRRYRVAGPALPPDGVYRARRRRPRGGTSPAAHRPGRVPSSRHQVPPRTHLKR